MSNLSVYKNPVINSFSRSNIYNPVSYDNEINEETYGKCGLLSVSLQDPLSKLINKISGLKEDDVNSVGFYYESEIQGVIKCTVVLFNTYDNDPVPWLRLGYTMDLLLASPFVSKIIFYPLVSSTNQQSSLLTRSTIANKVTKTKLEENFRAAIIYISNYNARLPHDKNISYTSLLLKSLGVTGGPSDNLVKSTVTGYTLVNKVLLKLLGVETSDISKISSSIIPCPLLSQPISISAVKERLDDADVQYVVEESRREITKLVAVFADLFTSHTEFRDSVIKCGGIRSGSTDINKLFMQELEFVTDIIGGFQNGIISSVNFNENIANINNERASLGSKQQLPLLLSHQPNIKVTDNVLMCTFKIDDDAPKSNGLLDLGAYIQHICDSFDTDESLTINIGGLVACYNNAIKGTKLNTVTMANKAMDTISRSATVIIPGNNGNESVDVPINNKIITIPMYNANLSLLTDVQLKDLLVYLDSLRSTHGVGNNKYTNLQNDVTLEIAHRNKKTKHR